MIGLRGHHLFCLTLFSGRGYSEAFTRNMESIQKQLNSDGSFLLLEKEDDVCSACPNLLPGAGCLLGTENVNNRDRAALRVLHLVPGREYSWRETGKKLMKVSAEEFEAVCGECRWNREGLCSREKLKAAAQKLLFSKL